MKRRIFLLWITGCLLAPFKGLDRVLPARYLEALRARRYPGPVLRRNSATIRNTGKWAG